MGVTIVKPRPTVEIGPGGLVTVGTPKQQAGTGSILRQPSGSGRRRPTPGFVGPPAPSAEELERRRLQSEADRLRLLGEEEKRRREAFLGTPEGKLQEQSIVFREGFRQSPRITGFSEEERQRLLREQGGAFVQSPTKAFVGATKGFFQEPVLLSGGDIAGIERGSPAIESFEERLSLAEGLKKDVPFSRTPIFGTVTPEAPTGFVELTLGQRQADIEANRNLKIGLEVEDIKNQQKKFDSNLQDRIDKEEITLEEAEKLQRENISKLNTSLSKHVNRVIKESPKDVLLGPFERKKTIRETTKLIVEGAALAGGILTPAIPIGFFGGKAIIGASEADTFGERAAVGLDVAFALGPAVGAVGTAGKRAFVSGVETAAVDIAKQEARSLTLGIKLTDKEALQLSSALQRGKFGQANIGTQLRTKLEKGGIFIGKGGEITRVTKFEAPFRTLPFVGDPAARKFVISVEKGEISVLGKADPLAGGFVGARGSVGFRTLGQQGSVLQLDVKSGSLKEIMKFGEGAKIGKTEFRFFGSLSKKEKNILLTKSGELRFGRDSRPIGIDFKQSDIARIIDPKELGLGGKLPEIRIPKVKTKTKVEDPTKIGKDVAGQVLTKVEVPVVDFTKDIVKFQTPQQLAKQVAEVDLTKTIVQGTAVRVAVKRTTPDFAARFSSLIGTTPSFDVAIDSKTKGAAAASAKALESLSGVTQDTSTAQTTSQISSQLVGLTKQRPTKTTTVTDPQITTITSPSPTDFKIDFLPIIGPVTIPKIVFPKQKKALKVPAGKQPYDAFVKSRGKQRQITDNLTEMQSLNAGAFVTDNSLAAEFSIKKDSGPLKDPDFFIPDNYFLDNQNKFRDFRQVKSRKIKLKNKYIENKNVRLDTPGEVSNITAARLIGSLTPKRQNNMNLSKLLGSGRQPKQRKKKRGRKG